MVDYAVIEVASMENVSDPAEEDLETYYGDNPYRYTAPEFRKLTFLHLAPDDLTDEVTVTEAEVRTEYEDRRESFITPEKRGTDQIVSATEEEARKAHDRLVEGVAFSEVVREMGQSVTEMSLGDMAHGDFFDAALGDAAFELAEGGFSQPIQTGLGWHILHVRSITPGSIRSYDEVREEVKQDLVLQKATDALYPLANSVEDVIAGGATLEEAADSLEVRIATIAATDVRGQSPEGQPVADLPTEPEFLSTAFELAAGEESLLTETRAGTSFVVRLDEITPSEVRTLDQVRQQVVKDWVRATQDKAAAAKAESIADRLNAGEDFAEIASWENLKIETSAPFQRDGSGTDGSFTHDLVEAVFALSSGNAASAPNTENDGHIVARLKGVTRSSGAIDEAGFNSIRRELTEAFAIDIGAQYRSYLRSRFPVEIDQDAVDNLL